MKLFDKVTLRLRITILTALVLTCICILLTFSMVFTYSSTVEVKNNNTNANSQLNSSKGNESDSNPAKSLVEKQHNEFAFASVIYMLIMIAVSTGVSYSIAGKALKPVTDLSKKIENIDENKLFQPLKGFDTNDEVARLASSFNHMIIKLEKAFSHQKQFAANAAHELKTPLASIIANIEVLQLDENPTVQEYKEVVDDTLANAQRLNELVHDLLKMNSTLNVNNCENINIKEMFDNIIFALSESSNAKNIFIENSTADIMIFGERALLQRAFFNLVQNAVKYNKLNGQVNISASRNDNAVSINIRDTGIGIPENELDNIFNPFYRIDTSRSRDSGGSGLGLSIVKSIIEKHNGKIYVESKIGTFSKITIVLPKI